MVEATLSVYFGIYKIGRWEFLVIITSFYVLFAMIVSLYVEIIWLYESDAPFPSKLRK